MVSVWEARVDAVFQARSWTDTLRIALLLLDEVRLQTWYPPIHAGEVQQTHCVRCASYDLLEKTCSASLAANACEIKGLQLRLQPGFGAHRNLEVIWTAASASVPTLKGRQWAFPVCWPSKLVADLAGNSETFLPASLSPVLDLKLICG